MSTHHMLNDAPVKQAASVCPDCGAKLRESTEYRWGTYKRFECGKISDDGPGSPCPNKPPREEPTEVPVEAVAPVAEQASEAPAEAAESFPVILVQGVLQEVKTVPELSKLDRLEAVLMHIEGFANMVVTKDDKKGADLADERRKIAKKVRVAVSKICKDEREEAVEELKRRQSFWISTDRSIETRLKAVEEYLAAQVKVYTDEKERIAQEAAAEKARIEAEAAAEAKRVLQARIQRMVDLGAVPNVVELAGMTEERFEAAVAAAAEVQAAKLAQQEEERIERERLAAEQRARTERIEARTLEVSRSGVRGWWTSLDQIADMTDDEFRGELAERIEAKALAEQEAERIRQENEAAEEKRRLEQAEEDARRAAEQARLDADRAELEAERQRLAARREQQQAAERAAEDKRRRLREAEEERAAAEAKRLADEARAASEAAERAAETARIEAERPDREKVLAWLDTLDLEVATLAPTIQSAELRDYLDGHKTILLRAIQAAKKDFQP